METIEIIKSSPVYKQIVKESYGGVCYMHDKEEYDAKEIIALWDSLTESQKGGCNGIIKGVFNFLESKEV